MKQYVRCLEDTVIAACRELGVRAHTSEYTGVWVGNKKIAAIGTVLYSSLHRELYRHTGRQWHFRIHWGVGGLQAVLYHTFRCWPVGCMF